MSKAGRQYRMLAIQCASWQKIKPFKHDQRLSVVLMLHPSNKRKWDIDNRAKACLDALQHAGIIPDDEQIDLLIIQRCDQAKEAYVDIYINEIEDKATLEA